MKYLTIFKPLIYISFSLSDTMSLMNMVRDPTRQAIGVGHVKTFGPIKESNWNGMNTYQFHQNFPGDTIGGHYMKRKRSKENIREAERYSKIVTGIPSVALPPRRDIP